MIIEIWSESEFNCLSENSRDSWTEIFSIRDRPLSFIKKLPNKFDVYRGGIKEGFSWTRDVKIAKWFQHRTNLLNVESHLMKIKIDKNDVLFSRKDESEIVVSPDSLYSMWKVNEIEILEPGNN